ncbi:MAG TPA: LamG domain-containing protein [Flavisolibacter sp.]|nr:LamG domain-containing protein [Flavisolibacter sp.]
MRKFFFKGIAAIGFSTLLMQCKKTETIVETQLPNYADSVKTSLWGYYTFSGNMADSSGLNHPIMAMNGATYGADKAGNASNALAFDGVNDFAVIDEGKNFPEGSFTVAFWMNPTITSGGRLFNKADFNTAKASTVNFGLDDVNHTNMVNFSVSNTNDCNTLWSPGSSSDLFVNRALAANNWYHIVARHGEGVSSVYINGKLVAATTTIRQSFKACTNAPWYFGIWWTGDLLPFKGTMDNIRIYTRTLNDKEIKWLYDNNK